VNHLPCQGWHLDGINGSMGAWNEEVKALLSRAMEEFRHMGRVLQKMTRLGRGPDIMSI
jgi:hypothetical protein